MIVYPINRTHKHINDKKEVNIFQNISVALYFLGLTFASWMAFAIPVMLVNLILGKLSINTILIKRVKNIYPLFPPAHSSCFSNL